MTQGECPDGRDAYGTADPAGPAGEHGSADRPDGRMTVTREGQDRSRGMKLTKRRAAVIVLALAAVAVATAIGTAQAACPAPAPIPRDRSAAALLPADEHEDVELDEQGRPDLRED